MYLIGMSMLIQTELNENYWANKIPMTLEEQEEVRLLRIAGCKCLNFPLLGYEAGVGPRCRICNIIAKEDNPKIWAGNIVKRQHENTN